MPTFTGSALYLTVITQSVLVHMILAIFVLPSKTRLAGAVKTKSAAVNSAFSMVKLVFAVASPSVMEASYVPALNGAEPSAVE